MLRYIYTLAIILIIATATVFSNEKIEQRSYFNLSCDNVQDEIERYYIDTVNIYPHDDNHDSTLKTRYRIWYYTQINDVPTDKKMVINIIGDGWRGGQYVIPVYSYDNINWQRFPDSCIFDHDGSRGLYEYSIEYQFQQSKVWISRTYPYPPNRVQKIIERYKDNPFFTYEIIGYSQNGYPLYLFTITNPLFPDENKQNIWIHSRTHPGETQSSYVLEGMINTAFNSLYQSNNPIDLSTVTYYIVPIVNIDGILCGNGRLTPDGKDLERQWHRQPDNDRELLDSMPIETKLICKKMNELIDEGRRFSVALNLHGKNAEIDDAAFLYTNFKKSLEAHGKAGDDIFKKQLHFAKLISDEFCGDTFTVRLGYNPNIPMQNKIFPESWWWANFQDKVMAATIEVPNSKTGCSDERLTPDDFFELGKAIAIASYNYAIIYNSPNTEQMMENLNLEYLMLYYKKSFWE